MKNMKVLVTGAAGFIGSHLVEEIVKKGGYVRAFVRYNSRSDFGHIEAIDPSLRDSVEIFFGDIQDPFAVQNAVKGCDLVFHLAALIGIPYSYLAPEHYVNTNVKGTLNVLEACRSQKVRRLVHTSTSEVYGTALYAPIDELHPLQGQSPYSASKISADKMAESYHLSFGLPVSTIRPFNTFGPRQSARAVIPTIITQALSGLKIIKLGSISPVRDFLFVKDTVQGFLSVAASDESIGQVTNIGFGQGLAIKEVAEKIFHFLGAKIEIETDEERVRPEKSEVMKLICNNDKAKQIMGWSPRYTLDEGLLETIEYMKANLWRYKTNRYNV